MNRSHLAASILATCVLVLAPAQSFAADGVKVLRQIPFSADAKIRQAVKDQCKIETDVPTYIDEFSDQVELVDGPLPGKGRVLELSIVDARAAGGGVYSGGKWVTVEGVLKENGRAIGNFTAKRMTIGYFNFGACGAARRCSKAVGKDIAEWLKDPQKDSKLGTER